MIFFRHFKRRNSNPLQSLFYLPAFRSLVLNYQPPESCVASGDDDPAKKFPPFDDKRRKIIEFMLVSFSRHSFFSNAASWTSPFSSQQLITSVQKL
jgi:hypothetical protein